MNIHQTGPSVPPNSDPPATGELPPTDMHFGSDADMLEWCQSEGIVPHRDEDGFWDWQRAWDEYCVRIDREEAE